MKSGLRFLYPVAVLVDEGFDLCRFAPFRRNDFHSAMRKHLDAQIAGSATDAHTPVRIAGRRTTVRVIEQAELFLIGAGCS
jgi:hypothetical protein